MANLRLDISSVPMGLDERRQRQITPMKEKRYKLMHFYKEGLWELFDLENDPYELNNLYGKPGMVSLTERLTADLRQLQEIYEVPESHRN
ncbi:MAG: DUF4976 domain-containing protein [Cyclobacteriaceae bacterium]|nr:DUF4976 domain-containing protein [Cyclobacteriaceae bacterium]